MAIADSERSFSRREEKRLLNLAAKVSQTAFPNPERSGCPSPELLGSMANRQIPLGETGELVDHIATCSPCFQEYWRYRRRHKRRIASKTVALCLGVLASIGIFIDGHRLWFHTGSPRQDGSARDLAAQKTYGQVVFDLRSLSASRSDEQREVTPARGLHLPRGRVLLLIYPPVGSEDGIYDIQLQLPLRPPSVEGHVQLQMRNHIETLEIKLDATALTPGNYLLRFRREESGWREYAVQVK
jgi:hypothetical protein